MVTLKIDKKQYTVGQRKNDRQVWLSDQVFAGLDCEVVVPNDRYQEFWDMYAGRF